MNGAVMGLYPWQDGLMECVDDAYRDHGCFGALGIFWVAQALLRSGLDEGAEVR